MPCLNSGQLVEHCKLSILQRIQPSSSPHFLKDISAHSLVILVTDLRLSSAALGLEKIQWVSCIQLTKLHVDNFSGARHSLIDSIPPLGWLTRLSEPRSLCALTT